MSAASRRHWRDEKALDLYSLAASLALAASPWVVAVSRPAGRIDAWAVGGLIAIVSLVAVVWLTEWEEWVKLGLAIWLVIAPWMLGFVHTAEMHISIGIGLFIAFITLLEIWLLHYPQTGPEGEKPHT
jgi:hypothetical protein